MSRSESVHVKRGLVAQRDRGSARRGFSRHLEGWQPGLLAIFLAGTAALLAVPRPVEPVDVPLPVADAAALALAWDADAERARLAERDPLDAEVRELGSAFRAFGLVDSRRTRTDAELIEARQRVLAAVGPALAQGNEAVLRLRAYQLRSFLREVRRWEALGDERDELRELGGDFIGLLQRNDWIDGGARRVAMKATVLAVLFKKRWCAVVGLQRDPFLPTLDEERALFSFLLSHPIAAGANPGELERASDARGELERPSDARGELERASDARGGLDRPSDASARAQLPPARAVAQRRRVEEQYRLKKIEELAALDPAYPKELARGIVLYRIGKHLSAVEALRRHIDAFPDGPYALRAHNYLRAALDRVRDE